MEEPQIIYNVFGLDMSRLSELQPNEETMFAKQVEDVKKLLTEMQNRGYEVIRSLSGAHGAPLEILVGAPQGTNQKDDFLALAQELGLPYKFKTEMMKYSR